VPRTVFLLRAILLLLALALGCLIAVWFWLQPAPNHNALALGPAAKSAALDLPIQPPVELDFKSKAEVLQLRTEAVARYPDLLAGAYEPSAGVFGQIVDGLPWWGIIGHFYHGSGQRSIEGAAEETRFLLNPYLLVAVEFDVLSYKLDKRRITEVDLLRSDFPFYCQAEQLRWQPREARAEVTYDLSQCIARTARWSTGPLSLADAAFSLIAYNARDLNLNYLWVDYAGSDHLTKFDPPASAYAIPHFIHQGGSCGYPGGCNNMSPDTPEISWLELTGLPAEVVVKLWRQRPGSVAQAEDMLFVIHLK
jgi:hypothetical protein